MKKLICFSSLVFSLMFGLMAKGAAFQMPIPGMGVCDDAEIQKLIAREEAG